MAGHRRLSPAAVIAGSALPRRVLLGVVTALIVAAPMVSGEDPGRLHSGESVSGVVLNLLWMITAFAGSVWLARSRRSIAEGGQVAAAMLAVAGAFLLSTLVVSCYRHPGWLMTWEWATLAIMFLVVQSLAAGSNGIIPVIAASTVSLAVFGLYQSLAAAAGLPSTIALDQLPPVLPPESDFIALSSDLSQRWCCRATFQDPGTLAAILLLATPILVGFTVASRGWHRLGSGVATLVVLTAAVIALIGVFQPEARPRNIANYLVLDHPLLGVGPGNLDRFPMSGHKLPSILPVFRNAVSELAATVGLVGLLTVLVLFVAMVWRIRRAATVPPGGDAEVATVAHEGRWEFYGGGIAGLLLGVVLWLLDMPASAPANAILQAGLSAAGRALVWFVSFALFDSIRNGALIPRRAIVMSIVLVGIFAFLSPAPLNPAVMQSLVALVAAATARGVSAVDFRSPFTRWWPVPVIFAGGVAYLFLACDPIVQSAIATTSARRTARYYAARFAQADAAAPGLEKRLQMEKLNDFLNNGVLTPFEQARRADPFDIEPHLEWASWYRVRWKIMPNLRQDPGIAAVQRAGALDPRGTRPLIAELQLRLTYMQLDPSIFRTGPDRKVDPKVEKHILQLREENLREARSLIARIAEREPALESRCRFRLAQTLLSMSDSERIKEGFSEAATVWELDESERRLPAEYRRIVRQWLKLPPE